MYSLHTKRENAHEESIWTCSWGRMVLESSKDQDEASGANNDDENKENKEDGSEEAKETMDFIVTGGMDDLVKVWEYSAEGELKLKHKLSEHSLGVVSVNLSKDSKKSGRQVHCQRCHRRHHQRL